MGSGNVEQMWYGLCLIEAVVTLFVVTVIVLLCKRFLCCILCNRVRRRLPKHPMVHPLGTLQPTWKSADLDPAHKKRRIG